MFKSTFSKYISTFMIIIVLSFIIVVSITSTAIGHYSMDAKRESLDKFADFTAYYIFDISADKTEEFDSFIAENREEIIAILDKVNAGREDVTLIIANRSGDVCLRAGSENTYIDESAQIPTEISEKLQKGETFSSLKKMKGRFESVRALKIVPLKDAKGEVYASVWACSASVMNPDLWQLIFRIVMGSLLWVLLAMLVAVYVISDRVTAPLREISFAAKKFASGRFDVRVPVRGDDEISEVARAFNNMAESLDNYENMRNSFISNVSHDLRSPMTSISGFIEGILDGVIPPDQHRYYLQIVSDEIKRLSRLVSSLLDISRIQAGERKFTKTGFDVCEMARQILISFEQKIESKSLQVEFVCQDERMNVKADRDAIYQVLYNLCDNGVKFARESGVLSIKIQRIKGKKLLVEVYNQGQGISEDDINYVFERFYKSDKSRGLNKNGAGLGLFISKTIIEAHGEKIWVESNYGVDCYFRFTLDAE